MIEFLIVVVSVLIVILFALLIYLWIQINSTDSRLVKLIENRIKFNIGLYKIEELPIHIIEESYED